MVDGRIHHFGAIGLINGLAVLADRETRTHWDHISGAAFSGPLSGHQLPAWPIRMTTVAAALDENPDISLYLSGYRSLAWKIAQILYPRFIHARVWLPFPFYASMNSPIDARLDKLTQGLGVIVDHTARYYPMQYIPANGLEDDWDGRVLIVRRGRLDGVPFAIWEDGGQAPMQLLSRWYGFSFTYPQCEIYTPKYGSPRRE